MNLRDKIGGLSVIDGSCEDNVAIALVTYFEDRLDCPDLEPGEDGWNPWAVDRTNELLDRIAALSGSAD